MKYLASTAFLFLSTVAFSDSITPKTVEKKLQSDFATADRIEVTSLQENYWGLYRNYKVSFSAHFSEGTLKVNCDLIAPRANEMSLRDCAAVDHQGSRVDVAHYYGKEQRLPAAKR